ncbi:MAG: hypothetical protein GXP37_11945, partial [Chloroflexi bacterium]|nr:hypothetical protein [Chloroflexota bacterium]
MTTNSPMQDPQYETMLNAMQRGDWTHAQELLAQLQAQYPDDTELQALASDIRYKSKLNSYWTSRFAALTARWPQVNSARLLRWAIGLAVIGIILYLVLSINRGLLQPRFQVQAEASEMAQLLAEGDKAYASGDYQAAMDSYLKAQESGPADADIEAAISRARTKIDVAQKYEQALKATDNLNYTEAEQLLLEIQKLSPHYSNVDELLPQIHEQVQMEALFYAAEFAYERQEWQKAVTAYEQILTIDATFHERNVKAHLAEAYTNLAQAGLKADILTPSLVDDAIDLIRKRIRLDPDNRIALDQVTRLTLYKQSLNALQQQDYLTATPLLEQIIQQPHDMLGQHINRDLYTAYLGLGDAAMTEGEAKAATDYYAKAVNVPDIDPAEARLRLEVSMARIPPTPTATP